MRPKSTGTPAPIRGLRWLLLPLLLMGALAFAAGGAAFGPIGGEPSGGASTPGSAPTITSDQADYPPGALVTLTGANWGVGEAVHIRVNDDIGQVWQYDTDVVAGLDGSFTTQFQLPTTFVAAYVVTATGTTSGTATTTFTDAAANLDQCTNGGVGDPPEPCVVNATYSNWVNGNSNEQKSHWSEDEFIPYRAKITGLTAGTPGHSLYIQYKTVHSGKHALDYLGSFDATETTGAATTLHANQNDPCVDVLTGLLSPECTPPTPTDTEAIPAPTLTNCATSTGTAPTPISGSDLLGRRMKIFGPSGTTIDSVNYVSENIVSGTGQCSTTMKISFTVGGSGTGNTVVLAWGGHIARGAGFNGWGAGNGASAVSGSPYHMSFDTDQGTGLDGASQGAQDRALSASAVIPPSTITIVKDTLGGNDTFGYTTTGGGGLPPSFNITTSGGTGQSVNNGINPGTYTVTESTPPAGWSFVPPITCTTSGGATTSVSSTTATITIPNGGGASATCTYTNSLSTKPNIATTLHNNDGGGTVTNGSHLPLGSSLYDVATLSDSGNPFTGAVTFKLWKGPFTAGDCTTGTLVSTESGVSVSGTTATSTATGALGAGSYAFNAQYIAGSDSHHTNSDVSDCEPFTIDQASSSTVTQIHKANEDVISIGGSAALGTNTHDKATVSSGNAFATPTGSVSFTFYTGGSCATGTPAAAGTITLDSNGVAHPSDASGALGAGSYAYKAAYGGDSNYAGSTSDCEPFTIDKAQLVMDSKVHDAAHLDQTNGNVPLGSVMHDTGKITGGTVGGFAPEAITFKLYPNGICDGTGSTVSNTGADEVATARDRSAASDPLAAGHWSYTAFVAGNDNYLGTDSGCEPFTVDKANTSTATTIHDASHNAITTAPLGSTVHDRAAVTDGATGFNPTGNVSFTFYTSPDCTTGDSGAGTVALDNGVAHPSNDEGPLAAGGYSFKAHYGGDSNFKESTSECEPLTISKGTPTLTTDVKDNSTPPLSIDNTHPASAPATVHDTATLGGQVDSFGFDGTAPAGVVTYRFYNNNTCSGTPADNENVTVAADGTVPDATPRTLGVGSYSYKAHYSGNGNYNSLDSVCEPFKVVQKSMITNTELCTFDYDTSVPGSTLRLLFTPDTGGGYKLNASNPGQFYYNVFDSVPGTKITFTLPYPFVTQGATPIHAYDGVGISSGNPTCLTPGPELAHSGETVSLTDYTDTNGDGHVGFGDTIDVSISYTAGQNLPVYGNIHVDYGLKGTSGYAKDGNNNAVQFPAMSPILIPDKQQYIFTETDGGTDSQTASSINVFKKNPGIAGLVMKATDDPVPNVPITIYDVSNKQVYSGVTDQDSWYMWQYKYTGKATTYTVKLGAPYTGRQQTVTMKSNAFVIASFLGLP